MATLEKIRSKQVFLFVVIILALLAFILGDFFTSGRTLFGSGTTIAQAGNAKVDYMDYQNRINAITEQQRNQRQQPDNDELAQQVLQDLMVEKLLQQEYDDLGIVVTDSEISKALTGANPHPAAMQFIASISQSIGLPSPSGAEVYQAMMNPAKYGLPAEAGEQLKQYWAAMEKDIETVMLREKFDNLVLNLFVANELDANSLFNDGAVTRHISYVAKDINSVADKDAEITDADRRAAWEKDRETYRLNEPIRSVQYIAVNIEPSKADRQEGQKTVEDALLALNQNEGLDAVNADSRFVVNRGSAPRSRITDNDLKTFIDSAAVGQAKLIKHVGDNYVLAKLIAVEHDIDSINVSFLGRADRGNVDSLLAQANNGTKFADLIDGKTVEGQDSIWASLIGTGMPETLKAQLTENPVGQAFIVTDTVQGQPMQTLYRINRRHNAVPVYDIATIDFTIDPSQETLSDLSTALNTFVSNNSSAADFEANAAEAGYTVLPGVISASSPHVANLADSRSVVKWVMEAKKGQVMPVYQDNKQTYLLTLAVKNIYDGEYLPWDADIIADNISAKATHDKKAQILIDRYNGKANDINGYAKVMESTVATGDAIFSAPMLATLGFGESALQGKIAAAEKGKISGPVQGNNAVVVFVVNGEDNSGREYTFKEYSNQFNRAFNLSNSRLLQNNSYLLQLLLGKEKVDNKSLNFIQGFGD